MPSMSKTWRIAGINFDHFHMGDLLREVFNHPHAEIVGISLCVEAGKAAGMKRVMPLNVAGAYHSRLMEPARERFAAFLADIPFAAPKLTVFTNTTGAVIDDPAAIKIALEKQVVSSVLWEDCTRAAVAAGAAEFWELGPGGVLAGLARRTERSWTVRSFAEMGDLSV